VKTLTLALSLLLSACCLHPRHIRHLTPEPADFQETSTRPARGTVILVHGLNQRPSSLDPLADEIRTLGYNTYRITLHGHEDQGDEAFSDAAWEEDLVQAYRSVDRQLGSRPIYLLGYSLGGLLVTRVLDTHPELTPRGVILLAPALSLRVLPQSGYLLTLFPPTTLSVPNVAPPRYRRFANTPLFWYRNIFHLYSATRTLHNPQRLASVPTVIVANPRDELVSLSGLQEWLGDNQLDSNWGIRTIRPAGTSPTTPEHLIIDQYSLGSTEWENLLANIKEHLR